MTTVLPPDAATRQRGLALRAVSFRYRGGGDGVRDLDLTITPGGIIGLLGPNGAGKTTAIKLLAGLLLPASGTVEVDGQPVRRGDLVHLRRTVGYAPCGERGLYPRLSARDNLRLFAALHNLPRRRARDRVATVLEQVELSAVAGRTVNQMSRGMRQRLHIARALLHQPPVVLVDEPTLGVDPDAARGIRLLLKSLAADGMAILLATNHLPEAADMCSRLTVLHAGCSVFSGPCTELMDTCAGRVVSEALIRTGLTEEQVTAGLCHLGEVAVVRRGELCLVELLTTEHEAPDGERVAALLGAPPPSWQARRPPNLEDAYTRLTRAVTRERAS